MKLIGFTLGGYRRFLKTSSLKLQGDVISIVGPNEAGRSSLLRAMAQLKSTNGFAPDEPTRRHQVHPNLMWQFELSNEDLQVIADIPEAVHVRGVRLSKMDAGDQTWWTFLPARPTRNLSLRTTASEAVDAHLEAFQRAPGLGEEFQAGEFLQVAANLQKTNETLTADEVFQLRRAAQALRNSNSGWKMKRRIRPATTSLGPVETGLH
jgi:ATPase subunit of ABC transporter with duplicated ATPase domains